MSHSQTRRFPPRQKDAGRYAKRVATAATLIGLITFAASAHAVDGCLVLLCLAAPSWKSIAQCVPPIRQLFRDLARGEVFPTCAMSGPGNSANHAWASAPGNCPPQYTRVHRGLTYTCDYTGAISVSVDGTLFSRTWWRIDGESVTEFGQDAKLRLGTWDTEFDRDYAAWLEAQEKDQESFAYGRPMPWDRLRSWR